MIDQRLDEPKLRRPTIDDGDDSMPLKPPPTKSTRARETRLYGNDCMIKLDDFEKERSKCGDGGGGSAVRKVMSLQQYFLDEEGKLILENEDSKNRSFGCSAYSSVDCLPANPMLLKRCNSLCRVNTPFNRTDPRLIWQSVGDDDATHTPTVTTRGPYSTCSFSTLSSGGGASYIDKSSSLRPSLLFQRTNSLRSFRSSTSSEADSSASSLSFHYGGGAANAAFENPSPTSMRRIASWARRSASSLGDSLNETRRDISEEWAIDNGEGGAAFDSILCD